jgi:probable F420-dependent oxidoreductase
MSKHFRFGVVVGHTPDLKSFTEVAREAESLGYDTLLAPDPIGESDPLTALSAAAAVTDTLRLGTFVLADSFRDAPMLDWQSNTLHTLTGGRFELGLGTGRPGARERTVGLGREYGGGGQRLERLAETISYLKRREDRPPLLIAGVGPKIVRLAAREADILSVAVPPWTTEAELKSIVDGFRAAAGTRDVELGLNLLAISHEPSPWLVQLTGRDTPELAALGAVTVLPGSPTEAADLLRRRRDELGISYLKVNSAVMTDFAPVVAALHSS